MAIAFAQPVHLYDVLHFLYRLSLENFKSLPNSKSNLVLVTLTIAGPLAERGPQGLAH